MYLLKGIQSTWTDLVIIVSFLTYWTVGVKKKTEPLNWTPCTARVMCEQPPKIPPIRQYIWSCEAASEWILWDVEQTSFCRYPPILGWLLHHRRPMKQLSGWATRKRWRFSPEIRIHWSKATDSVVLLDDDIGRLYFPLWGVPTPVVPCIWWLLDGRRVVSAASPTSLSFCISGFPLYVTNKKTLVDITHYICIIYTILFTSHIPNTTI